MTEVQTYTIHACNNNYNMLLSIVSCKLNKDLRLHVGASVHCTRSSTLAGLRTPHVGRVVESTGPILVQQPKQPCHLAPHAVSAVQSSLCLCTALSLYITNNYIYITQYTFTDTVKLYSYHHVGSFFPHTYYLHNE